MNPGTLSKEQRNALVRFTDLGRDRPSAFRVSQPATTYRSLDRRGLVTWRYNGTGGWHLTEDGQMVAGQLAAQLRAEAARMVLAAGVTWLYSTAQPEGAKLQHHGIRSPRVGDRTYRFVPKGAHGRAAVVVNVALPRYEGDGQHRELINPLGGKAELAALEAVIRDIGWKVLTRWNGEGETGSIGLTGRAHPALLLAVMRYEDGCPTHPDKGVFCTCSWYRESRVLLVEPTWPEAAR